MKRIILMVGATLAIVPAQAATPCATKGAELYQKQLDYNAVSAIANADMDHFKEALDARDMSAIKTWAARWRISTQKSADAAVQYRTMILEAKAYGCSLNGLDGAIVKIEEDLSFANDRLQRLDAMPK